jgi:hypothetical protein
MADGWINLNGTNAGARILPNDHTRSIKITNRAVVTLVSYHSLDLRDLVIEKGSSLTHDVLIPTTDFNTTTNAITTAGARKRIDLDLSGSLKLETGGKIDVSGKGYPGGPAGQNNGYGPGHGWWSYTYDEDNRGGSGAGYGGSGGMGYSNSGLSNPPYTYAATNPNIPGGSAYGSNINPVDYGSGGGAGRRDHNERNAAGGNGGGVAKINSGSIFIDANSGIYSNGTAGGDNLSDGGGGSGGSINISALTIYSRTGSTSVVTTSSGDKSGDPDSEDGADGSVYFSNGNDTQYMGNISANGGVGPGNAGGGSGGRIKIDVVDIKQICRITKDDAVDYIPSECDTRNPLYDSENGEVVLDGYNPVTPTDTSGVVVYADSERVWQGPGTYTGVCSRAPITEGGHTYSFRGTFGGRCQYGYFSFATFSWQYIYRDYTTLAYSAGEVCDTWPAGYAVYGAPFGASSADCSSKRSLLGLRVYNYAMLTHQPIIDTDMLQDTAAYGGVSGNLSLAENTTGTARNKKIDLEVATEVTLDNGGRINADALGYLGGTVNDCTTDSTSASELTDGTGPGAGKKTYKGGGGGTMYGGGGGFEGNGGNGSGGDATYTGLGGIYPTAMKTDVAYELEFGSGGGSAYTHDWTGDPPFGGGNNYACSNGGAGGGRIKIHTETIKILSSNSSIGASGGNYSDIRQVDNTAHGGGGSGGTVILEANSLYYEDTDLMAPSAVAAGSSNAGVGLIFNNFDSNVTFNFFASAGNAASGSVGGGGGGRILIRKVADAQVSIRKELIAVDRPGVGAVFNPYALRKDDVIKVKLTIGSFSKAIDIRDDFLSIPGSTTATCIYITGDPSYPAVPAPDDVQATYLAWASVFSPLGGTELSYHCRVQ